MNRKVYLMIVHPSSPHTGPVVLSWSRSSSMLFWGEKGYLDQKVLESISSVLGGTVEILPESSLTLMLQRLSSAPQQVPMLRACCPCTKTCSETSITT